MNRLIPVNYSNERYAEYEELLCRRDQLVKEAGSLLIAYTQAFGDKIVENFKLKVECIKKKKMIAYCQRLVNKGRDIDTALMNMEIDREMELYYRELNDLISDNKAAKESVSVGRFRFSRAKTVYRRLAKRLHPDINKKTMETPVLRELWERIVKAYRGSDIEELEDLEILLARAMTELGNEGFEISFTDIEERIDRVERQINDILTSPPYTYREILSDEAKKVSRNAELDREYKEYYEYRDELTEELDRIIGNGGVSIKWVMS